ncbi:MAG: alpha/beta hydrolase, partial [Bdellovibrionaceae bacterium]|nr:alpha/beta hydrolase [Bdellovibrio sp.]
RDGFVVFNATYRLAPKHTYPSAVDDLRDALAWLKVSANKYEIDINKISGWGYSAGAHLLLLVGLNPEANLKALVCGGTPADFSVWKSSPLVKGFMGCTYEENAALWNEASPVNQVQAASPPVFMYHGEWDFIVEIAQMQKMAQALESKNRPVETLRIPRMEHFGVYLFNRAWVDAGIKFIREKIN